MSSYTFLSGNSTTTMTSNGIAVLFTQTGHPGGTLRLNSSSGTIVCNLYEGSYSGNYTTNNNGMMFGWYVFTKNTILYYTLRAYSEMGCLVFYFS